MSITITLEATRLKCTQCEHLYVGETRDEVESRLPHTYSCHNCGEEFAKSDTDDETNKCPECGKFAALSDDYYECEECMAATDFEEVYVITCVCHDEEHEVYF